MSDTTSDFFIHSSDLLMSSETLINTNSISADLNTQNILSEEIKHIQRSNK